MKEHEFAILHEIDGRQFLVDTDYDHEEENFKLSYKFWNPSVNGYVTMTLSWEDSKEDKFKETFEKFRDPEYCKLWMENLDL